MEKADPSYVEEKDGDTTDDEVDNTKGYDTNDDDDDDDTKKEEDIKHENKIEEEETKNENEVKEIVLLQPD